MEKFRCRIQNFENILFWFSVKSRPKRYAIYIFKSPLFPSTFSVKPTSVLCIRRCMYTLLRWYRKSKVRSLKVTVLLSEVDTCVSSPCMNGGTCVNTKESYRCDCAPGYNGVNCEKEINECLSSPCYQASTCVNKVINFNNRISF